MFQIKTLKELAKKTYEKLDNWFTGSNYEYFVNKYEYEKWLNSQPLEKLKNMERLCATTTTSLFDIYREETKKINLKPNDPKNP